MRTHEEYMLNGTVSAAGNTGSQVLEHLITYSVQVKLVANGANGTVKLQKSNDGVTWFDEAGKTLTCINGTATALWELIDVSYKFCRLNYTRVAGYDAECLFLGKGV